MRDNNSASGLLIALGLALFELLDQAFVQITDDGSELVVMVPTSRLGQQGTPIGLPTLATRRQAPPQRLFGALFCQIFPSHFRHWPSPFSRAAPRAQSGSPARVWWFTCPNPLPLWTGDGEGHTLEHGSSWASGQTHAGHR